MATLSAPITVDPARMRKDIALRVVELVAQQALTLALLLGCAGRWDWERAWLYALLSVLWTAATAAWVLPRNPEVVAARAHIGAGTRAFEKPVLAAYAALTVAIYVVAGLDERLRGEPLGPGWAAAGALVATVAMVVVAGAMAANRNLEPTVRIQSDRGHAVATTGPYRHVRHPMYAALLLQVPSLPLILGSTWALVPAMLALVPLVVRTSLEDRTLRADLPGYGDYAARTPWRLVPKVW